MWDKLTHPSTDTSFLGSNVSANSWFSMATNVTTLISQVSGAIAAFWGNNTNEDNEFTASIEDDNLPDGGAASDSKLRAFTFPQLKASTSNFRRDMVLGKGGFGSVYKGWIKENVPSLGIRKRAIAVKKLDANSKQGFRQWRTEVGFLARLSHPNIVKLLGYCKENENFLIVYEFMQKGSLNYHLFGRSSDRLLPWEARLKIMTGMAQGLSYLHMMEKPIIFRDFKSSNVLLDEILATSGDSHVTGHVVGTVGYTAPEYIAAGWLYVKSDVYSFGVVIVEMLTGRKAIDKNRPSSKRCLVEWVKPYLKQKAKLRKVIDSRLEGKFSPKEAIEIALIAIALVADKCLNSNHKCRPSMIEVAERLKKIEARYRTINEG
ncbi:serine/threonine-protein kinase cx32, putative [Ricinus communis]|uniref:non-specific serine/threonine protein kinase n=1 Tax=Ricinus communis TaxID=3988 RepID=B9SBV8_RICCO|nr:serine/threonine-protein kinase cx32, putative [Ricinus communis]